MDDLPPPATDRFPPPPDGAKPTPFITRAEYEREMRLQNIFLPHTAGQIATLFGTEMDHEPAKMVHYTTAESALKIIGTKRFWMRNTNCMSDYREVQHGYDILSRFFSNQENKNLFHKILDECCEGVADTALQIFDNLWGDIRFNTYICSMSEHQGKEGLHGRLSMWRAFGGTAPRVGIVINIPTISQGSGALNLVFSPVSYLNEHSAHANMQKVMENIRTNREFLGTLEGAVLVDRV
jgi:hypothetical protein